MASNDLLMPDIRAAGITFQRHAEDTMAAAMAPTHMPKADTGQSGSERGVNRDVRYGIATLQGEKAENLIKSSERSEIAQYFQDRKESIYASRRRRPLGGAFKRGQLPSKVLEQEFAFGIASPARQDTKQVLYSRQDGQFWRKHDPQAIEDNARLMKKVDFHYDWSSMGVDPQSRFGHPPESQLTSAASLMNQDEPILVGLRRRENYNVDNKYPIGRAKPPPESLRQFPYDHSFGLQSKKGDWNVRNCISGEYSEADTKTSETLGRRVLVKGSKPEDFNTDLPAGTPSIQRHKKAPTLRSISNLINYGDTPMAQELIYPPKFSFDGIEESDFTKSRPIEELQSLFAGAGYATSEQDLQRITESIKSTYAGESTIMSFQAAYNLLHPQYSPYS